MSARVRLVATLVALSLALGCGTTQVARPPAPEDEVARLQRNVTKVRFAQEATKELIERSRGQPYLPDLYLRLAELYVEEARYHYFIAFEGQKRRDRTVTSVQAKLLKDQAIAVYRRLLDEFPEFQDRDKVLFFISHEHRELGEYDKMLDYLRRVVEEHPKSRYRNESLLVMGDFQFDKGDLDAAEKHYRTILEGQESPTHAMARYKLAWVRINKEDFKGALGLFEDTIENLQEQPEVEKKGGGVQGGVAAKGGNTQNQSKVEGTQVRRIDLRREALVDLVFPYTEVHKKPAKPLQYFRGLADSRTTYLAALSKLGRRWFVKGEYELASLVYRELLTLGADSEDSVEWAQKLYDGVIKNKKFDHVAHDVALMGDVLSRRRYDWRLGKKERDQLYKEFEAYARDLATKAQLEAESKKDLALYARAGDAYEQYLVSFAADPKAVAIRQNLAEARFAAKQFLAAGRAYEQVMDKVPEAERKEATYTAVVAFANALKEPGKLSRLDLVQARAGLRHAATLYIDKFPKADNMAAVKFNFAKSYYDEGLFEEAAELFAALVGEYPSSSEASVSAELALDALRAREDFEELARLGKLLAGIPNLPQKIRDDVTAIVAGAEARALDVATLKAGAEGDGGAVDGLLEFAAQHKSSGLGEKALINAFVTARNTDDLEKVTVIGEQLLAEYPKSDAVPDVLATLGKMSAQAVDFERAAKYLEESARRRPRDAASLETLKLVGTIKASLGDMAGARAAFDVVLAQAQSQQVKRDAALGLAELMERGGDWGGAAQALATASDGAKSAAIDFRLGYALMRSGRQGDAERHLESALATGRRRADDPEEADGAAGAAYYLGQDYWEPFAGISFGGDRAEDGQTIKEKFAALAQFEEAMVQVIQLQSPNWALAALGRLAAAYEHAAGFLENAPLPPGLDAGGQEKYRAALGARAADFRAKAKEAMSTCSSKAAELRVFSPAARACVSGRALEGDPNPRQAPPSRRAASPGGEALELRKKISKNSKDYDALGKLATLYLKAGDPHAAKLVLDKAAEGGADAATYNLRGVVAHALGYHQDAYEEFKKALEEDAGNVRARMNLSALYRSYGYAKLAEAEAAKVKSTAGVGAGDPGLIAGGR